MDLAKVLTQLRAELENLNMAIASLERLASRTRPLQADALVATKRASRPRKTPAATPAMGAAIQKRTAK
jgi:hypothetical protein